MLSGVISIMILNLTCVSEIVLHVCVHDLLEAGDVLGSHVELGPRLLDLSLELVPFFLLVHRLLWLLFRLQSWAQRVLLAFQLLFLILLLANDSPFRLISAHCANTLHSVSLSDWLRLLLVGNKGAASAPERVLEALVVGTPQVVHLFVSEEFVQFLHLH